MASRNMLLVEESSHLPGCERLGKLLFLQLDPTLRNLLAVLQRHQELIESSVNATTKSDDLDSKGLANGDQPIVGSYQPQTLEEEEQIIGLLKAEAELLLYARNIVSEFPNRMRAQEPNASTSVLLDQQMREAMIILLDYISLPLVAILRRPVTTEQQHDNTTKQHESLAEASLRKLHIRQGAERKSIGIAARTLKTYLEVIMQRDTQNDSATRSSLSLSESCIPTQKIIQLVLACSSALPSGQDIAEQSTASFGGGGGLDRGEEYLEALLDVTSYLLRIGSDTQIDSKESGAIDASGSFGQEVTKAMDGALVTHLADVCLSIVAPPSTFHESTILGAACTLQSLLATAPDPSTWRGLFPGCFAALFRTLVVGLRGVSSTPQSKPKVIVATLKALSMLLRLTLKGDKSRAEKQKGMTLASLKLLAKSEGGQQLAAPSSLPSEKRKVLGDSSASYRNQQSTNSDSTGKDGFLSEINTRLPGPLTVLARLLVSAESSSIRQHAADFCQIILIDTRSSWDREVIDGVSIMALESCLVLTRDSDYEVISAAQTVVKSYQKTPACKQDMNSLLVPRILSMIEELPALARRQSESDLRNKFKLITAFLSLDNLSDKKDTSSLKSGSGKALRSVLAAENVSLSVRRALAELLDIDFGSPNVAHGVSIELLDQQNLLDTKPHFQGSVRRKHLTPASDKEATAMIRGLGQILGAKHAAIFVDACVADLFNDCVARVEAGNSRFGRSQEAWCHQWIGCLTLIREVLIGVFVDDGNEVESSKSARKKLKYLSSLATSILPIIVSAPLWNLPVSLPDESDKGNDLEVIDAIYTRTLPLSSEAFTSAALRGNAYFLCGLVQLVTSTIGLLQKEAIPLIPVMLPPLLEHATTTKVPSVMEEAQTALECIACSVGYKSLACMIDQNMGVVAGAMLATLRLPGGKASLASGTAPAEIFKVAHTIRSVLQLVLRQSNERNIAGDKDSLHNDVSSYSYLLELVMTLTERYDCLASKNAFQSDTTIAIVGVYEAAFRFLIQSYKAEETAARVAKEQQRQATSQPWLERLNAFRILQVDEDYSNSGDDLETKSPKEGFEAYHNKLEKDQVVEEEEEAPISEESTNRLVGNHETHFVAMLVSRCTFFFSNASLRLQVESCAAMAEGFRFLAIVALLCKDPEDKTGTAILRQVSDAWPAIHARLVALTTEIQSTRVSSIVVLRQSTATPAGRQPTVDVSTKRVFVSRLLELVAIMAECSGDFIASRFKNDVFPLVSQMLGSFAEDLMPSEVRDDLPSYDRSSSSSITIRDDRRLPKRSTRQASETALIVSMIQCFVSVFRERACGKALAGLIPACGALVLPFLGEDGELGRTCMAALQQMVQIDCDALWRPLVQLSGSAFPPPKPWLLPSRSLDQATKTKKAEEVLSTPSSLLQRRAKELVDFIDGLPEQELIY